ncbi:MAG: sugar transporter [Shinella sp.]|nr:MAG: sugar transporter [Shinella sp.]
MAGPKSEYRRISDRSASSDGGGNVSLRRYLDASQDKRSLREDWTDARTSRNEVRSVAAEQVAPHARIEEPFHKTTQVPQPDARELADIAERKNTGTAINDGPLVVDLQFVFSAAWKRRTIILAGAVVCGLLGGAMTTLLSKNYSAAVTLYFDPQKLAVELVDGDRSTSPEVLNATIDSQTRIITSYSVLENVAKNLKLTSDPEFVGKPSGNATADMNAVVSNLQKHVEVARQDSTYIFQVKVKANTPDKSADIANAVVAAYLTDTRLNAESSYGSVNAGLVGRLTDLRQAVIAAEAEVRDFTSKNDLYAVGGDQIADKRLQSLDDLLVTAQHKTISAKAQLDTVSKLGVDNVLIADGGGDNGSSRTIADLRNQYASLSANVSSLTERLGPRHPQLQSAKASLEDVKRQIRSELERMVVAARNAYQSAQNEEADLVKEMNVQKASQATNSTALIELSELERKAKAARDIYEAVLKRSEETSAQKSLYESNVRIVAQAIPSQVPDGPSRKALLIAGVFGGGVLGLGLGVVAAVAYALYARIKGRSSAIGTR